MSDNQLYHFDIKRIIGKLLKHRKLFIISLSISLIFAVIYSFGLPDYYTCTVKLAPETSGKSNTQAIDVLARAFKLGQTANADAIYPKLYPQLTESADFKISLFDIRIKKEEDSKVLTYYEYLLNEQKLPWWGEVQKSLRSFINNDNQNAVDTVVNIFKLTRQQIAILDAIQRKVTCDLEKKTGLITISVIDQDPVIAAILADSVRDRLQRFITSYRVRKASIDLAYNKKMYNKAKARYEQSKTEYTRFADSNRDLLLTKKKLELQDLDDNMQLHYKIYNDIALQVLASESKVQEEKPAFTVIQRATVPLIKTGPSRIMMCLVFVTLIFISLAVYVLYRENELLPLLNL